MDLHAIKWHKQKNHLLGLYKKKFQQENIKMIFLVNVYF